MTTKSENSVAHNSENLKQELATLREDLSTLRGDMGDVLRSMVELGKHTAGDTKDRVSEEFHHRLEQMQEKLGKAEEASRNAVRGTQHTIEEHPLTSVCVAFGVGLLAGHLIRRKG